MNNAADKVSGTWLERFCTQPIPVAPFGRILIAMRGLIPFEHTVPCCSSVPVCCRKSHTAGAAEQEVFVHLRIEKEVRARWNNS